MHQLFFRSGYLSVAQIIVLSIKFLTISVQNLEVSSLDHVFARFPLDTRRVVVQRLAKQMPWPDRLLKVVNSWGKKGKRAIQRGHLKFLNRNGEKFDWENDDLANLEADRTEEKLVYPDFITEIPWLKTETDYEDIVGHQSASQEYKPTVAQRVAAARQSAGRDRNVTVTSRGVDSDSDKVSATQSVIDLTDNNLFLSSLPTSVNK